MFIVLINSIRYDKKIAIRINLTSEVEKVDFSQTWILRFYFVENFYI